MNFANIFETSLNIHNEYDKMNMHITCKKAASLAKASEVRVRRASCWITELHMLATIVANLCSISNCSLLLHTDVSNAHIT